MDNRQIALDAMNAVIAAFMFSDNTTPESCKWLADAVHEAHKDLYPEDTEFFVDGVKAHAKDMLKKTLADMLGGI